MYVTVNIDSFDIYNIYFGDKQKNNIIDNCYFSNIYYSTHFYTLNNIVLSFKIELNTNNEHTGLAYFNTKSFENKKVFETIEKLEKIVLEYYNQTKQECSFQYSLTQQLERGYIKLQVPKKLKTMDILLRISGIWENKNKEIGLIYKFLKVNSTNLDQTQKRYPCHT